ncbi:hypothetical protein AVEN_23343-1 [Araneus ventricosus]|uniref:Uncharacterized protein n=1 Tax=Araneus ventricosus TaxID=182803 RepID=A0A4Y2FS12_ARAVE|nr:hypothetical protein AVEN_23343-1 [Araneus ventricosus]
MAWTKNSTAKLSRASRVPQRTPRLLVVPHRRPILEGFLLASVIMFSVQFYRIASGGCLQIWILKLSRWSLSLSIYQLEFLEEPPPLIPGAMPQVDWLSQNPTICRAHNVKLNLEDCL